MTILAIPSSGFVYEQARDQRPVDALKEFILVSEQEYLQEAEETAESFQHFLAESQQRIQTLLTEMSELKIRLVNAESERNEEQSLLTAQLAAKDQELAFYKSEVDKLTLAIQTNKERARQRVAALKAQKNEAIARVEAAAKIDVQAAHEDGEAKVVSVQTEMQARLMELEAKVQESDAKVAQVLAKQKAVEQAAMIREADLMGQLQEHENAKRLEPQIRENAAKRYFETLRNGHGDPGPPHPSLTARRLTAWRKSEAAVPQGLALLAADELAARKQRGQLG